MEVVFLDKEKECLEVKCVKLDEKVKNYQEILIVKYLNILIVVIIKVNLFLEMFEFEGIEEEV